MIVDLLPTAFLLLQKQPNLLSIQKNLPEANVLYHKTTAIYQLWDLYSHRLTHHKIYSW